MSLPRPFQILGVQQIAIGSNNKSFLAQLWCDELGLEKVGQYTSTSENVEEDILRIGNGPHAVEVDLMQPLDASRTPRVSEPALNHIGLWVDDLVAAYSWLNKRGVRFAPGGVRRGASGHLVCFIHPKPSDEFPISGSGVLIELVQAPESVIAASSATRR